VDRRLVSERQLHAEQDEIWSANVAYLARHAAEFGTNTGRVAIDMVAVRRRKRDMVDGQIAAHLRAYKDSGAELILGSARFVAPKTLEVRLNAGGTRLVAGDQVFVNTGTHATMPDIPGLQAADPLTSIEALEFDHVPPHLIVLGGGYVGLEFAQAYRRFGSRVTIIQQGPQLLSQEDPDVSEEVLRILSDEGIECLVGAQTLRVQADPEKTSLSACARRQESGGSRAATSSSRWVARRTPRGSASSAPGSS
jgi:pyruvate/2-oxoglutarate dehydrogenase complex dihydrolipoamide dehydrogenase (E3) component